MKAEEACKVKKRTFDSYQRAKSFLLSTKAPRRVKPYICPSCARWHLTSRRLRPFRKTAGEEGK